MSDVNEELDITKRHKFLKQGVERQICRYCYNSKNCKLTLEQKRRGQCEHRVKFTTALLEEVYLRFH